MVSHCCTPATPLPLQDDLIGFRVGIPLDGDIVIALWFGDIVRETDTPAFVYAFHTAFVGSGVPNVAELYLGPLWSVYMLHHGDILTWCGAGVLRIEPRDMTVPAGSPLNPEKAAFDGFFMDVNLEDGHQKLARRTFCKDAEPLTLVTGYSVPGSAFKCLRSTSSAGPVTMSWLQERWRQGSGGCTGHAWRLAADATG